MYDVICVGSSTVDAFAKTQKSELIKIFNEGKETDLLAYPTGAKILIKELDFTTGGGGTNTAVSFSRLGLKTAYLGCVGNDANAEMIINELKREKVDTRLIVKKKGGSGYSIILDSIEHDRTILAYKGVNNELSYSDIKKELLKTRWFYFSAMMEKSFAVLEKLAEFAEKNRIKIVFNPSSYLAEKGKTYLKKILSHTEILVLNKEEAALISGKQEMAQSAKTLISLGPSYVVITDGKNGAHCLHEGIWYFAPTTNVKPIETTGAGDAFASSFLAGLLMKNDIEFALKLGTTNAESVISHHGAKNKLLTVKEAMVILRKRPIRVKKM